MKYLPFIQFNNCVGTYNMENSQIVSEESPPNTKFYFVEEIDNKHVEVILAEGQ
jgi:hypothetical protein